MCFHSKHLLAIKKKSGEGTHASISVRYTYTIIKSYIFFILVQGIHSLRILQEQNWSGSFNFEKIYTRFIVRLSLIFSSLQMLASVGLQVALYQPVQVSKGKTYHLVMAIQFFWSRAGLSKVSDTACCKKPSGFIFLSIRRYRICNTHTSEI